MDGSSISIEQGQRCAALAGEALPGLSMSAPCQEDKEDGEDSASWPYGGIPLRDFLLEETRGETL